MPQVKIKIEFFLFFEAIELITLLMEYSVKESIIKSLVNVLKPPKRMETTRPDTSESKWNFNIQLRHISKLLYYVFKYPSQ